MARAQAEHVAAALGGLGADVELVTFTTSGDRWHGPLTALGGKGAFVRELDRALLDGQIDLAVHCLKDIPGEQLLPDGLALAAFLPRDDVRDALVARAGLRHTVTSLADLPGGAVVGTSAVRRRAQLARQRPDLDIRPVRGNANTRLAKLDAGDYDVLVLALAGLQRIGVAHRATVVLPTEQMMPAVGAGTLAITTRSDDAGTRCLVARLDDPPTARAAAAERALLLTLAGNCHSPIAGLAEVEPDGDLRLAAAVYSQDGSICLAASHRATAGEPPSALGRAVAEMLLSEGARELIDAIHPETLFGAPAAPTSSRR
jgi:hydroxymethylbilane synthase